MTGPTVCCPGEYRVYHYNILTSDWLTTNILTSDWLRHLDSHLQLCSDTRSVKSLLGELLDQDQGEGVSQVMKTSDWLTLDNPVL